MTTDQLDAVQGIIWAAFARLTDDELAQLVMEPFAEIGSGRAHLRSLRAAPNLLALGEAPSWPPHISRAKRRIPRAWSGSGPLALAA